MPDSRQDNDSKIRAIYRTTVGTQSAVDALQMELRVVNEQLAFVGMSLGLIALALYFLSRKVAKK